LRRIPCPWFWRALVVSLLVAAPAAAAAGEGEAPVNIFLGNPDDLGDVWKVLAKPDFVILRGDEYARLTGKPAGAGAAEIPSPPVPWAYAVGSVAVEGRVRDDQADLAAEFLVHLAVDGPVWVTLRLDRQTLHGADEGDRPLPLRSAEGGAWQVELTSRGRHTVRVGLTVPVRVTPEGKRIELAVPEAPSTRFSVDVPQRVEEASAGPGEPLTLAAGKESGQTRLAAALTPRGRLAVVWKVAEESGRQLPPLLMAQGEIAVDIDAGTFRTRSSWAIRSVRGSTKVLELRLDPEDEVLELELDGQIPPSGTERVGGANRMTIPLAEALGPGQEHTLVMTTRRPIPTGAAARLVFHGFPLANARGQEGAVGIATAGHLWVTGTDGRGVRRIDPRTELPADLRARPSTELAYRFSEQPFDLTLRVEPSPPQVVAAGRTTVVLGPEAARVDTWLDFETTRGRLFDLNFGLPPGMAVESVGPAGVVSSWQTGVVPSAFVPGVVPVGLRLLTVRLGPRAQDGGRFSIHLVGRQPVDPAAPAVTVGLFPPIGVTPGGDRLAVLTDPGLSAELADRGGPGSPGGTFRPAPLGPTDDWSWPAGLAPAGAPALWLRTEGSAVELPLRLTSHPRSLAQSTALTVRVGRREAEVRQETECSVQFGSLDHVDLLVPASLEGRWEVDAPADARRTDLGTGPQGSRTVRLTLPKPPARSTRLRVRYRVALDPRPAPGKPIRLAVPWLRVVGAAGPADPARASISAEPGLAVAPVGDAWSPVPEPPPAEEIGDGVLRLVARDDGPGADALPLQVEARALALLPTLVAPRLSLRTVQTPEGELRTTASYRVETLDPSLAVALPPGASLLRVRVGGEPVRNVEPLPDGAGVRVLLPPNLGAGAVLVELDYETPPGKAGGPWLPPRLLGGVVQQTRWEVRLPWNRAVVGVPTGWSDENEWYWDTYVWKRRPWPSASAPPAKGADNAVGPLAEATAADADNRGDYHSYLFSRPGRPDALAVRVASRAWLVAVCSGSVLAVGGLTILVWRPSFRLAGLPAAGLGLVVAALLHPSVTFLAVQSATVGVVLTALLALMQGALVGRRPAGGGFHGPNLVIPPGSTLSRSTGVGSDDSTAIRARPVSTAEYVVAPPPPPPDAAGRGTRTNVPRRGAPPP